jgi:hypothetical protein
MKECMNCGGPVADDDSHCTTCGLPRGSVIYGERPSDDDDEYRREGDIDDDDDDDEEGEDADDDDDDHDAEDDEWR